MATIEVTRTSETEDAFRFDVEVDEAGSTSRHVVTLRRKDAEAVRGRFPTPEGFVRWSFEFLLEREPKESILARFDVRDIAVYFPEFDRDLLHPEA